MSVTKISALVIVLVGLFIGYRLLSDTDIETVVAPVAEDNLATIVPKEPEDSAVEVVNDQDVSAPSVLLDEPDCLTVKQFEELPELMQDFARMDQVSAGGSALSSYENLGEDTLRSFADQGDSAAMVIIGAMSVMRAYEMNESLAVGWLNGEQGINDLNVGTDEPSPSASLALNDAAYWFYEAASHGRIFALQQYGQVKGRLFGGPVGLGWISQEEFDELSSNEKASLDPSSVFGQVAYDIAPSLREGALGSLSTMTPQTNEQRAIRKTLHAEFEQHLVDAELPPIQVAATASDELEELYDRVCESEKQEALRRQSLRQ